MNGIPLLIQLLISTEYQPDVCTQQCVQSLSALRQFCQRPLPERLRERVEQAPDVPLLEFLIPWLTPFMENRWNEAVGTYAYVGGSD